MFKVIYTGKIEQEMERGCPQGSCLSPIHGIFNARVVWKNKKLHN